MKAPAFWDQPDHLLGKLLSPLGILYDSAGQWIQSSKKRLKLRIPMICVGNLTLGGTGKTPVALLLGQRLKAQGRRVHFLTRGYKGSLTGPVLVDGSHTYHQVGDEALLLAALAPTWVAKDRRTGAQAALAQGAEILILDDGFQNLCLDYDLALLVMDTHYGIGNGRIFPAGPLRESITQALARAQGLILVGDGPCPVNSDLPLLRVTFRPLKEDLAALNGQRWLPFAGLGRPQKFFEMLKTHAADNKYQVLSGISYPDHHAYTSQNLAYLKDQATQQQARLVTTAKDAVKLPFGFAVTVVRLDPQMIEGCWDIFGL